MPRFRPCARDLIEQIPGISKRFTVHGGGEVFQSFWIQLCCGIFCAQASHGKECDRDNARNQKQLCLHDITPHDQNRQTASHSGSYLHEKAGEALLAVTGITAICNSHALHDIRVENNVVWKLSSWGDWLTQHVDLLRRRNRESLSSCTDW